MLRAATPAFVLHALAVALPVFALACSGNAVVEPAQLTSKRAKFFLDKCQTTPPEDGTELKTVYACLDPEDACPAASDPAAKEELGYLLNKGEGCSATVVVYDVPCGPDLNAIECCYAVRLESGEGGCD